MAWLRLTVDTPAVQVDALTELLEQFNACCVSYQPASTESIFDNAGPSDPVCWQRTSVTALLDAEIDIDILLACIRNRIGTDKILDHSIELLQDMDWSVAHKLQFQAIQIANRLLIRPGWDPAVDTDLPVIILEPGLAFGTGKHATTALCLEWLATNDLDGKTVIDYGCGSGILALASLKLGANFACAVDLDQQALLATQANAARNLLLDRLRIEGGDVCKIPPADILLANILCNPLLELAPVLAELVLPDGDLVLSGILANQTEECLVCYGQWFNMLAPIYREEWALLHGRRKVS